MKHAKQYFDNHSSVDKLYFTSDNLAFFDEQNAINHARNLEDDSVTELSRGEIDNQMQEIVSDNWEQEMEDLLDDLDAE